MGGNSNKRGPNPIFCLRLATLKIQTGTMRVQPINIETIGIGQFEKGYGNTPSMKGNKLTEVISKEPLSFLEKGVVRFNKRPKQHIDGALATIDEAPKNRPIY